MVRTDRRISLQNQTFSKRLNLDTLSVIKNRFSLSGYLKKNWVGTEFNLQNFTMGDGDASVSLDKWRDYFRSSNSDIFNVIEHAIIVAACDYPYDFKLKRDRIAEMLFVSKMTKCFGCDRTELFVTNCDGVENKGNNAKSRTGESKDTEESKVNDNRGGGDYDERMSIKANWNRVSNCSFGDADALTDEIDEEFKVFEEVLRIKEILDNKDEESVELLFDSLRQLQLMQVSLEILKVTDIGKSVKVLQKHASKDIQNLVTALMEDWRIMIDAWVKATAAITGSGVETESVKMSTAEEEEEEGGLPSPPLDEGAFFTTTASMELSKFFDAMDDDGNLGNIGALNKNQENSRKLSLEKRDVPKSKLKNLGNSSIPPNYRKVDKKKNQEVTLKKQILEPNRPQNGESQLAKPKPHYIENQLARQNPPSNQSRPMRPKLAVQPRVKSNIKIQQKPDTGTIQKKPMPPKQKLDFNNEASVQMKLEVAKRKLQESYQAAENAKKQRTIQVVELHDLPNKSFAQRNNQHMKTSLTNKNRPKLRR